MTNIPIIEQSSPVKIEKPDSRKARRAFLAEIRPLGTDLYNAVSIALDKGYSIASIKGAMGIGYRRNDGAGHA